MVSRLVHPIVVYCMYMFGKKLVFCLECLKSMRAIYILMLAFIILVNLEIFQVANWSVVPVVHNMSITYVREIKAKQSNSNIFYLIIEIKTHLIQHHSPSCFEGHYSYVVSNPNQRFTNTETMCIKQNLSITAKIFYGQENSSYNAKTLRNNKT